MVRQKRKKHIHAFGGANWLNTPYKDKAVNIVEDYVAPGLKAVSQLTGAVGKSMSKKDMATFKEDPDKMTRLDAWNQSQMGNGTYSFGNKANFGVNGNAGIDHGTWGFQFNPKAQGGSLHQFASGGTAMNQISAWADITGDTANLYANNAKINDTAINAAKMGINQVANTKVTSNSFDSLLEDQANFRNANTNYTRKDFQGMSSGKRTAKALMGSVGTSMKGFQATGNWVGAVIGGAAGLAGGLFGQARAKRQARRQAGLANKYGQMANQIQASNYAEQAQKLRNQQATALQRSFVANGGLLNFGQDFFAGGGAIDYINQQDYLNNYRTVGLSKNNILQGMTNQYIQQNQQVPTSFGFGGNLGTNGSNFTDGLTYFDEGGRHEDNPNQGIPQGIAPDGNPNLVEEGEVKWNEQEYIFSDRLRASAEFLDKYKLKQFADKTYAYIVKNAPVVKEAEQRPNDDKSQRALDAFLAALAEDQEIVKKEKEAKELQEQLAQMSPEELAALGQQLQQEQYQQEAAAQQQAQQQEQAALGQQSDNFSAQPTDYQELQSQSQQEYADQQAIQQQVAQQEGLQQPMMGAEGGHLHALGGATRDVQSELSEGMEPQEQTTNPFTGAAPQEPQPNLDMAAQESIPQEGMQEGSQQVEESTESMEEPTQESGEYKSAEEMSTKELNAALEEIIQFAIQNKDRQLLREAKKIKRKGSREDKEEFVDEVHEEMQEMEAQQETGIPKEEQSMQQEETSQEMPQGMQGMEGTPEAQPSPEELAAMQQQSQEEQPAMFAEGGSMNLNNPDEHIYAGEDTTTVFSKDDTQLFDNDYAFIKWLYPELTEYVNTIEQYPYIFAQTLPSRYKNLSQEELESLREKVKQAFDKVDPYITPNEINRINDVYNRTSPAATLLNYKGYGYHFLDLLYEALTPKLLDDGKDLSPEESKKIIKDFFTIENIKPLYEQALAKRKLIADRRNQLQQAGVYENISDYELASDNFDISKYIQQKESNSKEEKKQQRQQDKDDRRYYRYLKNNPLQPISPQMSPFEVSPNNPLNATDIQTPVLQTANASINVPSNIGINEDDITSIDQLKEYLSNIDIDNPSTRELEVLNNVLNSGKFSEGDLRANGVYSTMVNNFKLSPTFNSEFQKVVDKEIMDNSTIENAPLREESLNYLDGESPIKNVNTPQEVDGGIDDLPVAESIISIKDNAKVKKAKKQAAKLEEKLQDAKDEAATLEDDDASKEAQEIRRSVKTIGRQRDKALKEVTTEEERQAKKDKALEEKIAKKAERDYRKTFTPSERREHSDEFRDKFLSQRETYYVMDPDADTFDEKDAQAFKKSFIKDYNTQQYVTKYGPIVNPKEFSEQPLFSMDKPANWDYTKSYGYISPTAETTVWDKTLKGINGVLAPNPYSSQPGNGENTSKPAPFTAGTAYGKQVNSIAELQNLPEYQQETEYIIQHAKELKDYWKYLNQNSAHKIEVNPTTGIPTAKGLQEYRKLRNDGEYGLYHYSIGQPVTTPGTPGNINRYFLNGKEVYGDASKYESQYGVTQRDNSPEGYTDYDLTGKVGNKNFIVTDYGTFNAPENFNPDDYNFDHTETINTTPGNKVNNNYYTEKSEEKDSNNKGKNALGLLNNALRYAPLFNRPFLEDENPAFLMGDSANNLRWVQAPDHRQMLEYKPVDTLYRVNQVQQEGNAARRGITNTGNNNTGMVMANLALQNAKNREAIGEVLLGSEEENWNRLKDTIAANNQTNATFDQMRVDADKANMSNNSLIVDARQKQAQMLHEIDKANQESRSKYLADKLGILHKIGNENNALEKYWKWKEQSGSGVDWNQQAEGGEIKIRRKQRIKRYNS